MRLMVLLSASALVAALPALAQEPPKGPGTPPEEPGVVSKPNDNAGTTTYYAPMPGQSEKVAWPCAQRKVETISAATIWSGPNVAEGADWDQDNKLAALAQTLASRRTSLDDADKDIADFAKAAGPDKDKQLTKLFVGVLDILNSERSKILQGIERYAAGQQHLAERLREESDAISETQDQPNLTFKANTSGKAKDFEWDQRIFTERRQALSYVCETPSILERRAYDIAQRIQQQL